MDVHDTIGNAAPPAPPPQISIDTNRRAGPSFETNDEPLSPVARLFQDIHILLVIGLEAPFDISNFRAGIEATLVQHPRFCSIRVCVPAKMFTLLLVCCHFIFKSNHREKHHNRNEFIWTRFVFLKKN